MLSLLLSAQLLAPADSTYSSTALRELVGRAVEANRRPPAEFQRYTSRIETELSLILRDTLGRELTASVEQVASAASWDRNGRYDLHIVGYRSQSVGVPYSTLTVVKGWTVPSLYGNRLSLGTYFARAQRERDTLRAVHPFATDREQYYRFTGGDTITTLRAGARSIPIARVRVHPAFRGPTRLAAFDGEIDLDADRAQIVRMRGRLVMIGRPPGARERFIQSVTGAVAVAYVEFVNAEIGGKYWLPAFQRTEFQSGLGIMGQTRPVFRLVSNIRNITVNDDTAATDSTFVPRVVVSWAPSDSVNAYSTWDRSLGSLTASVHSDDFDDLAPDVWRPVGPPRFNLFPTTAGRMFRFNRVEGLFTGFAPSVDFRSAVPGLTAGAHAGWAWTEKTVRGGAFVSYRRAKTTWGVRAERTLANTNDFVLPLGDDPGLGAILASVDNYDYVDRRSATVSLTRLFHSVDGGLATLQLSVAEDRNEQARLERGPLGGSTTFRLNRGVAEGRYVLASADVELNPSVNGDYVRPGLGARLHYENGSGDLAWQRAELMLAGRRHWGPVWLAAHADAGAVFGVNPPPQRLFELGGNELLPGYDYKEFAGDRAALLRTFAGYRFNLWKRPIPFIRNMVLPAPHPGIAVSAQAGWAELSSPGAVAAAAALGMIDGKPVSQATNGMRATVGGGLTFFSDVLHVGVARPVDRPAPWKFVFGFGGAF